MPDTILRVFRVDVKGGPTGVDSIFVRAIDRDEAGAIAYWRGFEVVLIAETQEHLIQDGARVYQGIVGDPPPRFPSILTQSSLINHPILTISSADFLGLMIWTLVMLVLGGAIRIG